MSSLLATVLFADDTTLISHNSSYINLANTANNEFNKINQWLIDNRLSINLDKTFAVIFTNRAIDTVSNPLKFDNKTVNLHTSGNFLGVCIDNKLSFKYHVDAVCSKLSKTIGIFVKLHTLLPEKNLINLYYSLFLPIFTLLQFSMGWLCTAAFEQGIDCYYRKKLFP